MRLRRRPKPSPPTTLQAKPYRVTIHAAGDQHHTYAMGPGDGLGVGTIRIDIDLDGGIHATPIEPEPDHAELAKHIRNELHKQAQRSGHRRL